MTQHQADNAGIVHHVLWTGGWDSTFRVLDLALTHGRTVQPHYLADPWRASAPRELQTIRRITDAVLRRRPRGTILPPIVTDVRTLADDPVIRDRWQRARQRGRLGPQYEWLARYATQHGLSDLELGVHMLVPLEGYVARVRRFGLDTFALAENAPDDLQLFARFTFPIADSLKADMRQMAADRGFADLMELTWFCHTPLFGRFPCGRCYPCRLTYDQGLGDRIGPLGRLCMLPRFILGDARDEALSRGIRALRQPITSGAIALRRRATTLFPFLRKLRRRTNDL